MTGPLARRLDPERPLPPTDFTSAAQGLTSRDVTNPKTSMCTKDEGESVGDYAAAGGYLGVESARFDVNGNVGVGVGAVYVRQRSRKGRTDSRRHLTHHELAGTPTRVRSEACLGGERSADGVAQVEGIALQTAFVRSD